MEEQQRRAAGAFAAISKAAETPVPLRRIFKKLSRQRQTQLEEERQQRQQRQHEARSVSRSLLPRLVTSDRLLMLSLMTVPKIGGPSGRVKAAAAGRVETAAAGMPTIGAPPTIGAARARPASG